MILGTLEPSCFGKGVFYSFFHTFFSFSYFSGETKCDVGKRTAEQLVILYVKLRRSSRVYKQRTYYSFLQKEKKLPISIIFMAKNRLT